MLVLKIMPNTSELPILLRETREGTEGGGEKEANGEGLRRGEEEREGKGGDGRGGEMKEER